MTTAAFKALLGDLEYPDIDQLRGDQLGFMCSDPNLRRFIDYLSSHVKKDKNFLTDEELQKFNQLKSDGLLISDPGERRRLLEQKQATQSLERKNQENQPELDWAREKLAAANQQLDQLLQLERQLITVNRQEEEVERKRVESQRNLMTKHKRELKDAQAELMRLDIEFRGVYDHLAAFLAKIKPSVESTSILSSLFLTPTAASRCVSSVQEAIVQCHRAQRSLHDSKASDSCLDETVETEISKLVDAFQLVYLERFIVEMRLDDLEARREHLDDLKGRANWEEALKATDKEETMLDIKSMKDTIKRFIGSEAMNHAKLQAESFVAKAFQDDYRQRINAADLTTAKEKEIFADLERQLDRLSILKLLLSEEQRVLRENCLSPTLSIQKALSDRDKRSEESKTELKTTIAGNRNQIKAVGDEIHVGDNGQLDNVSPSPARDQPSKMIMDLIAKHSQAASIHRCITNGFPELDDLISKRYETLTAAEKKLSTVMKEFDAAEAK